MLNGAPINSCAVNSIQFRVVSAYVDIKLEIELSGFPHDVIYVSTDIISQFDIEGSCVRVPQVYSNMFMGIGLRDSSHTVYASQSDTLFAFFISPSSVFAAFAYAIIEIKADAIANGIFAEAEISFNVDIIPKPTAIISVFAVVNCSIDIDNAVTHIIALTFSSTDITFISFFAPDLNFIRNTAANSICSIDIEPYASMSPRLSSIGIEFGMEADTIIDRSEQVQIDIIFDCDVDGTKVRPAITDSGLNIFIEESVVTTLVNAYADILFHLRMNAVGRHHAFAYAECSIAIDFTSIALYKRPTAVNIGIMFQIEASPFAIVSARINALFGIVIDPIEKHIKLAEQVFADNICKFIVSPIPAMIHGLLTQIGFRFDVSSNSKLAFQGDVNAECRFSISSDSRLALQAESFIEIEFYPLVAVSNIRVGYCDMLFELELQPEAIIGGYEPADECRTIYITPDFNIIFVPYEDRELRIAC